MNPFRRLLLMLQGRKLPTINYRHRGLGTALLQFEEGLAQRRHGKRITGRVVEKDYDAWPELLNWYVRRGFTVTDRGTEDDTDIVAWISKKMQP